MWFWRLENGRDTRNHIIGAVSTYIFYVSRQRDGHARAKAWCLPARIAIDLPTSLWPKRAGTPKMRDFQGRPNLNQL